MTEVDPGVVAAGVSGEEKAEAKARTLAIHVAWVLPCLAVTVWFFGFQFQGLRLVDAMDAAQVGRHVSEGHGFTTGLIRPFSLAKIPRAVGHPDLYNAPLYPLILGIAFNLGGAEDRTVGVVATVFGLVTVLLCYLLGSRLLDRRAGMLAAVLACLNLGLLQAAISGLNITLLAALIVLLFYLILGQNGTPGRSLLCGVVCGLAYLTEYIALPLALPAAAVLFFSRQAGRLRHLGLFAAGFVGAVLPWLLRNWRVAGSPFATLKAYSVAMYGTTYPLASLYRLSSPDQVAPLSFLGGHFREVAKKLLVNLNSLESVLAGTYGLWLLPLLGLSLFVDLGSASANRLKWALLVGMALMGISLAAGQPRFELLYALLGVVAALGATAFVVALQARGLGQTPMVAATVGLLALAAFPIAVSALPSTRASKPDRRNLDYLGRVLAADAIVVSDQPWAVAWYANRTAIWLPQAPSPEPAQDRRITLAEAADATRSPGFQALEQAHVRPSAIYLSGSISAYPAGEGLGRWQLLHDLIAKQLDALQKGQAKGKPWVPPGWTLFASLPPSDFLLVRAERASGQPATKAATAE